MGFFAQVTQLTTQLVTSHGPALVADGLSMFRSIAVILVVWEGCMIAFGNQPVNKLANLLVSIAITYSALVFYATPFPGVGRNLTQIVTDSGATIAESIDTSTNEQVGAAVNDALAGMSGSVWDMVTNVAALPRYVIILLCLSAIQIVILAIIAFGFVALGVLVLIGPIMIPFMLVPGLDWIAWGWFRSLIQYSFYPVVGNAFIYVYGTIWLNFFSQFHGMDSQKLAGLLVQIIVVSMAGFFGILKMPQFVAGIFSGGSGISAMPSVGWWR